MDTPVIDLTAAPDSPGQRSRPPPPPSSSSSSSGSEDAPLVATSMARRSDAQSSQDTRTANAVAGSSNTSNATAPTNSRRRVPYPRANAANTPIDLTDDDIEYLGEHRLHLPEQPHVEGNEARPVSGDNYSLMDRLRNAAGIMPFSRHASSSSSSNNNNRVIEEDPIRYGLTAGAGPGPAAVAAANARARRNARAVINTINGNNNNNNNNPPAAGLNARRNRQRAQNAQNANNNHGAGDDPAPYYYRPARGGAAAAAARLPQAHAQAAAAPPPPARARAGGRGGRRQRAVYAGLYNGWGDADADEDEEAAAEDEALYHYMNAGDNDFAEDIDFQPHIEANLGGLLVGPYGRGGGAAAGAGAGPLRNIMQLLGFGMGAGGNNAHPANGHAHHHHHVHFNHANPPRRKVKAYSVRQSHPNFNKKKDGKDGFERDIVPPPEIEEAEEEAEPTAQAEEAEEKKDAVIESIPAGGNAKAESEEDKNTTQAARASSTGNNKGKGRALEIDTTNKIEATNDDIPILDLAHGSPNTSTSTSASSTLFSGMLSNSTRATSTEHQLTNNPPANIQDASTAPALPPPTKPKTRIIRAPVCTSCSGILYLNQSSKGRPYVLLCGHVVCKVCLDAAATRLKRWTTDEPEVIQDDDEEEDIAEKKEKKEEESAALEYDFDADDRESSLPSLPTKASTTAWKGARLKERFEEVDSTAGASTSTASKKKDRKGKKKATTNGNASTSSGHPAPGPSTSTRSSRRNAQQRPDYAELDGDEEGQPDGSYVPRNTQDGMDEDDSEANGQVHRDEEGTEDEDESTLRSLIRKKGKNENSKVPGRATKVRGIAESSTDEGDTLQAHTGDAEDPTDAAGQTSKAKGKGKIKIVMNGTKDSNDAEEDGNTATITGKRKRGTKADVADPDDNDETNGGKSTNSTKAKKAKIEKPPLIDVHWLTCPVNGCKGGTDLRQPIGSREGAWELFV